MSLETIARPSPNFDSRKGPPDMIVLHYTGMQTGQAALERLCDHQAKVSAHYLIEEDGRIFTLVAIFIELTNHGRYIRLKKTITYDHDA